MVNGQLISSLVRQLNMIGIPKSFQDTVITAVTTGTFSSQAKQFKGTPGDHQDRERGNPGCLIMSGRAMASTPPSRLREG